MTAAVIGGGLAGLSAGLAGGLPVYEAADRPGGICSTYRKDGFLFEVGGGHWLWGGTAEVVDVIELLSPLASYQRRAAVKIGDQLVPFPLQNHLHHLGQGFADRAMADLLPSRRDGDRSTLAGWLRRSFGDTLYETFFGPFHDLYTAGLSHEIAPVDPSKSPVDLKAVVAGARGQSLPGGYNQRFWYPMDGFGTVAAALAASTDLRLGTRAVRLGDGQLTVEGPLGTEELSVDRVVAAVPLDVSVELAGIDVGEPDPYTSVLVVNIGAQALPSTPAEHWVYVPKSDAGFHRVGFYSNVSPQVFLPAGGRDELVSCYVEFSFRGGEHPTRPEVAELMSRCVQELQSWGWIGAVQVVDPTWVDRAYTWRRPGSTWVADATDALNEIGVYPAGRYGRWAIDAVGQSIVGSIRDGSAVGALAAMASRL